MRASAALSRGSSDPHLGTGASEIYNEASWGRGTPAPWSAHAGGLGRVRAQGENGAAFQRGFIWCAQTGEFDRSPEGAVSRGEPTTPLYFFHIHHADQDLDEVGTELPDLAGARVAAHSLAHRLLLDDDEKFWRTTDWLLEVKDETGRTVFTLRFRQGVAVH